ncbi:MAG: hypothetical protein R6V03_09770 [Kiritimatiellia bacterium]
MLTSHVGVKKMKGLLKLILVVAVLALAAYIILPTFPGHKHPPYIRDMNNLKMIYMGCMLYAMNHGGEFPLNLEALTETEIDNPSAFVRWQNRQSAGALTNVSEWTDYVYIPGRTEDSPHDAIVAYLPPGVYTWKNETGAAVVFADGSMKWMSVEEFTRALNKRTPTTTSTVPVEAAPSASPTGP